MSKPGAFIIGPMLSLTACGPFIAGMPAMAMVAIGREVRGELVDVLRDLEPLGIGRHERGFFLFDIDGLSTRRGDDGDDDERERVCAYACLLEARSRERA